MTDAAKINALLAEKVKQAASDLVADLRDDVSRSLERLNALKVALNESELEAFIPAAAPQPAPAAGGAASLASLRSALTAVESGRSQVDVLTPVVERAVDFAARAAMFVVKQNTILGWKAIGFEADGMAGADVRKVQFTVDDDTLFKKVRETPCVYVGAPGAIAGNSVFLRQFKGSPTLVGGFPLVTKNRISAILYADNGREGGRFDFEALMILTQMAGMAVDLIGVRPKEAVSLELVDQRPAPKPAAAAPAAAADEDFELDLDEEPVPAAKAASAAPQPEPEEEEFSFVDEGLGTSAIKDIEPEPEEPAFVPPPPPLPKKAAAPPPPPSPFRPAPAPAAAAKKGFDAELAMAAEESFEIPAPKPAPAKAAPKPAVPPPRAVEEEIEFTDAGESGAAASVGSDDSEEHEEAKRFARLLVSEIKLYNEQKVTAGKKKRDIYERLKDDIERSLKVYRERIPAQVTKKRDYFYEEMVKTLAGGDAGALGNYPHKP